MTNLNADYFTPTELDALPLKSCGQNVLIHRQVTIVDIENLSIGSNVRIDGYVTLLATGSISLGSHVHIGAGCYLAGRGGITMRDFSGLSQGVRIYSASDDYSGRHLTNPTVPEQFLGLKVLPVEIGRHAILGAGAVVLPGVVIDDGVALGALSLLNRRAAAWTVWAGTPARQISMRHRTLLSAEASVAQMTRAKAS